MMRLIDADELKEWIEAWFDMNKYYHPYSKRGTIPTTELFDILDRIQTVGSVKHGRWIPCEERMPEEPFGCLVTVMDTEPMTGEDFENLLPYFVGWDGEQWNDADGQQCPFEVLAWIPLPEPWKMGGDEE